MTNITELQRKLESGSLVLTANKRLSRHLESGYEALQLSCGMSAWLRPAVYPLEAWCRDQYDLLADSQAVISKSQGRLVWERLIEESVQDTEHELLQITSTAEMAWNAEKLLNQYQASFTRSQGTEDQQVFLKWQKEWRRELKRIGMVDPSAVPVLLSSAIADGRVPLPDEVIFIGFDDLNPTLTGLQASMQIAGCKVTNEKPLYFKTSEKRRHCCANRRDEVQQCAIWVRNLLEKKPDCKIGIVAPDLRRYRDLIEQLFHPELDPRSYMLASDAPSPYNISVSPALSDEPVVRAALKLLQIGYVVEMDELAWLLRSPYLASSEANVFQRAACDRQLRRFRRSKFLLENLESILREARCDAAFVEIISSLAKFNRTKKKDLPGAWSERFLNLLDKTGWPGDRKFSSHEYQAIERFRQLFSEFASLDQVTAAVGRQDALHRLGRLAAETEFQQEGAGTDIHIIGILESSGIQFDALWILGMHAAALPRKSQPNPFVPVSLQRKLQMPHADATRELAYADAVMSRLYSSAPLVVASWPQAEEGMPVMMSHYLKDLPDASFESLPSCHPTESIRQAGLPLAPHYDNQGPPVTSRKTVSGGTAIIKDQALCPFRAFAHHRLRAEELEVTDIGIDMMTRGSLIHKVLELFWEEIRTRENLLKQPAEDLRQRLQRAAISSVESNRWKLPSGQKQIEIDRLVGLALKWLEIEKKRPEFEVIQREKSHTETIGRLQIKTIIDRVDKVENGRIAIIDYKTGRVDPAQWFEDRIAEPQLPIYCLQLESDLIEAVAFAVVRPGTNECKFSGIARECRDWPGISKSFLENKMADRSWQSFDQIIENWRNALCRLGDDFMNGLAVVDPSDPDKACRFCDLMTLCRIHESDNWITGQE